MGPNGEEARRGSIQGASNRRGSYCKGLEASSRPSGRSLATFRRENRWGMSARLEVRFGLPIKSDERVTATAEKDGGRGSIINTKGWIALADGRVAAEATGSYVLLSQDTLDEMAQEFPGLARSWRVGNGGG